jgi:hypothetical protein
MPVKTFNTVENFIFVKCGTHREGEADELARLLYMLEAGYCSKCEAWHTWKFQLRLV